MTIWDIEGIEQSARAVFREIVDRREGVCYTPAMGTYNGSGPVKGWHRLGLWGQKRTPLRMSDKVLAEYSQQVVAIRLEKFQQERGWRHYPDGSVVVG